MNTTKQVKVDNWGIFFLQRLKHFFNRTDYCDLTLQFQENAQLKVHRLVLNACTEYFEILERTCEMYEDCLIMPDDLQADVVVPIVNFMYTGQLEYKQNLFDRLYQTAQVMNMNVLTKLLDAQRVTQNDQSKKRDAPPRNLNKTLDKTMSATSSTPIIAPTMNKKVYIPSRKTAKNIISSMENSKRSLKCAITTPILKEPHEYIPVQVKREPVNLPPKPTRYELPAELDNELLYENSFSDISYDAVTHSRKSVHIKEEEDTKLFDDAPESNFRKRPSTSAMSDSKSKKPHNDINMDSQFNSILRNSNDAFDSLTQQSSGSVIEHIIEKTGARVTIETKTTCGDDTQIPEVDHAKIINEVLKKYPHLVKNNKNIKLKIISNDPPKPKITRQKLAREDLATISKPALNPANMDYPFITDVSDAKAAAALVSIGAENTSGPWICLICGAPGKALTFPSYYKFRRHLVEIHKEKAPHNMCEYCGLKSNKRNHMLHHMLVKHNVEPPSSYHFPRCDRCPYIALTDSLMIKHEKSHASVIAKNFRCNVCLTYFGTSKQLLHHIQVTGHKISPDRRSQHKCVYCSKVFLRENNLYSHLKLTHKKSAKKDGIIDDSDEDEFDEDDEERNPILKHETQTDDDSDKDEYQLEKNQEGNIVLTARPKLRSSSSAHQLLNSRSSAKKSANKAQNKINQEESSDESTGLIDNGKVVILSQSTFMLDESSKIAAEENYYTENDFLKSNAPIQYPQGNQRFSIPHKSIPTESRSIEISYDADNQVYEEQVEPGTSLIFEEGDCAQVTQTEQNENPETNVMFLEQDFPVVSVNNEAVSVNSDIVLVYSEPLPNETVVTTSESTIVSQEYVETQQIFTTQEEVVTEEWRPNDDENEKGEMETVEELPEEEMLVEKPGDELVDETEPMEQVMEVEIDAEENQDPPVDNDIEINQPSEQHVIDASDQSKDFAPVISDPEIRNLTSEWSDDEKCPEEDARSPEQNEKSPDQDEKQETEPDCDEDNSQSADDVEESIENIQEEMNKQVQVGENTDQINGNAATKVEVSTLLNDWDESEGTDASMEQSLEEKHVSSNGDSSGGTAAENGENRTVET